MSKSFSELWEEAENLFSNESNITSLNDIMLELKGKLSIYEQMDLQKIPDEDKIRLKTHIMGKIILVLTQISLKENINVYIALKLAIDDYQISSLEQKYKLI